MVLIKPFIIDWGIKTFIKWYNYFFFIFKNIYKALVIEPAAVSFPPLTGNIAIPVQFISFLGFAFLIIPNGVWLVPEYKLNDLPFIANSFAILAENLDSNSF